MKPYHVFAAAEAKEAKRISFLLHEARLGGERMHGIVTLDFHQI